MASVGVIRVPVETITLAIAIVVLEDCDSPQDCWIVRAKLECRHCVIEAVYVPVLEVTGPASPTLLVAATDTAIAEVVPGVLATVPG